MLVAARPRTHKPLDKLTISVICICQMTQHSTRQAAKKLGIDLRTLNRYIAARKIPLPLVTRVGEIRVRLWTEADIEKVREILPRIQNGRKNRHKKQKKQVKEK